MTTTTSVDERAVLGDAVRRCLLRSAGPRPFLGDGDRAARTDGDLWRTLAEQLGVSSLLVPEAAGGAGVGYAELAVVVEELGRSLAPVPVLATAGMASGLLLAEGGPVCAELLTRIARDGTVATVVWPDVAGPSNVSKRPDVVADLRTGTVSGTASFVVSGAEADLLLVPAATEAGVVVMAVDGNTTGMIRRSLTTLDLTRGMAEVAFDCASARLVVGPEASGAVLSVASDLALTVLSAELVGVAQASLDAAVEWAKQRVQFERPIGSFQAVKHQLVDLLMQVELARSAMEEAVNAADRHLAEPGPQSARALRAAASMSKALCSDAAVTVSRESLHLFGGIGFTWEHDAHLRYRRALAGALLLGDAAQHRVRLAAAVGV
ncbi:MAG: acyl-CoA dehydrogenase family protein [Mycobacteriales bacterium]